MGLRENRAEKVKEDGVRLIRPGLVVAYTSDVIPDGWLECDGAAISRTVYQELFDEIGTRHGIGDGATTFNIPDIRGKFIRGYAAGGGDDPDFGTRTAVNGGSSADAVGSIQPPDMYHEHAFPTGPFNAVTRWEFLARDTGNAITHGVNFVANWPTPAGHLFYPLPQDIHPDNANLVFIIKF